MKIRAIVFTALVLCAFAARLFAERNPWNHRVYESRAYGMRYVSLIDPEEVRKTPQWTEGDNPPCPALKAIKLADARRKSLAPDTDDVKWSRTSATIIFGDTESECYWKISYEANKNGPRIGSVDEVDLFILMDGTLIEPEVSEDPSLGKKAVLRKSSN
jgi:hypothetical protein